MTKLRTFVVCLLLVGGVAYGLTLGAPQLEGNRRGQGEARQRPAAAKSRTQPQIAPMAQYVVEPPDVLVVQLLEGLPGRPINGERLVRPDGTISLGFYGDLYVTGLTLPEIKKKLIAHLQPTIKDEHLGLIKLDDETAEPVIDSATGKIVMIDPKDSDRVSVDIKASKSKYYYLQGAFALPGRAPITGKETVLDAIAIAGGLTPDADHNQVYLYREDGKGGPVRAFKIVVDQITLGDDLSTNYQLVPGDRLVVRRRAGESSATDNATSTRAEPIAPQRFRLDEDSDRQNLNDEPSRQLPAGSHIETIKQLDEIERKMDEIERKINLVLEALKSQRR